MASNSLRAAVALAPLSYLAVRNKFSTAAAAATPRSLDQGDEKKTTTFQTWLHNERQQEHQRIVEILGDSSDGALNVVYIPPTPSDGRRYYLVGTVHALPKQSSTRACSLIRSLKPDTVVLELVDRHGGDDLKLMDLQGWDLVWGLFRRKYWYAAIQEAVNSLSGPKPPPSSSRNNHHHNHKQTSTTTSSSSSSPSSSSSSDDDDDMRERQSTTRAGMNLECLAAKKVAEEVGATVILADSPWYIRSERLFRRSPLWTKLKLLMLSSSPQSSQPSSSSSSSSSPVSSSIDMDKLRAEALMWRESMTDQGRSIVVGNMDYHIVMVHERDLLFVDKLKRQAKGPVVVGVFGLGHLGGILDFWDTTTTTTTTAAAASPPSKNGQEHKQVDIDKIWTPAGVGIDESLDLWLTVHQLPEERLFTSFVPTYHDNGRKRQGCSRFALLARDRNTRGND